MWAHGGPWNDDDDDTPPVRPKADKCQLNLQNTKKNKRCKELKTTMDILRRNGATY